MMFNEIKKGKYWDKPLTLVSGCTHCSPGCDHCWALAMEARFRPVPVDGIVIHPERLDIPLRRKKPTVWAVWNDLFHEDVPNVFIDRAFAIMALSHQHIFLVLTKRSAGVSKYLQTKDGGREPLTGCGTRRAISLQAFDISCEEINKDKNAVVGDGLLPEDSGIIKEWPFKNIWLGITVCNQQEADEKIPLLLQIPAAVRWISIEPMLGPVNLDPAICDICGHTDYIVGSDGATPFCREHGEEMSFGNWLDPLNGKISWVVLGGETGPGARPLDPQWVESVRDQCVAASVPFFFKSWGEWCGNYPGDSWEPNGMQSYYFPRVAGPKAWRCGKKLAGRLLDGREWNELPSQGVLI